MHSIKRFYKGTVPWNKFCLKFYGSFCLFFLTSRSINIFSDETRTEWERCHLLDICANSIISGFQQKTFPDPWSNYGWSDDKGFPFIYYGISLSILGYLQSIIFNSGIIKSFSIFFPDLEGLTYLFPFVCYPKNKTQIWPESSYFESLTQNKHSNQQTSHKFTCCKYVIQKDLKPWVKAWQLPY